MQDVILAIDIGGSKYMAGLVDGQGQVLDAARYPWGNVTTGEAVLAHIRQAAQAMLDAHPGLKPRAIGATIPGLADPRTGMWVEASFSGVGDVAVGPALQAAFPSSRARPPTPRPLRIWPGGGTRRRWRPTGWRAYTWAGPSPRLVTCSTPAR